MRRIFDEFSEETTAHAVRQIFDVKRRIWARLFWFFLLIFCTVMFAYQLVYLAMLYLSYPTTISTSIKYGTLPFPSVTFCNNNPLKYHMIKGTDVYDYLQVYKSHLKASTSEIKKRCDDNEASLALKRLNITLATNESKLRENQSVGTQLASGGLCRDFYKMYAADKNMNYARSIYVKLQMKAIYDIPMLISIDRTKYQYAFNQIDEMLISCVHNMVSCTKLDFELTFNSYFGHCYTFNPNETIHASKSGSLYGLRILIDLKTDQYLPTSDAFGAKVVIHSSDTIPTPELNAYSLASGFRTSLGIITAKSAKLPYPYGKCRHGKGQVEQCMRSCHQRAAEKRCLCTIFEQNSTNPCSTADHMICYAAFNDHMARNNTLTVDSCNCAAECEETSYDAEVSEHQFHLPDVLGFEEEDGHNSTEIVELEVYYKQLNYKVLTEEAAYQIVNLFSDFGGSVGLWLGASVLTLGEVITLAVSICFFCCGLTKRNVEMKNTIGSEIRRKSRTDVPYVTDLNNYSRSD